MSDAVTELAVGRAFGKIIVLGEHAVVYGQPALAAALSRGCEVHVQKNAHGVGHLLLDTQVLAVDDADNAVCRAVQVARAELELTPALALDVSIRFDVPVGAGLGSSAALAVALPRALAKLQGRALEDARLETIAHRIEQVFHGNPSGLDALLARTGALGLFTRGAGLAPLTPKTPVKLVIADTGVGRSTQTQVANVAARRERVGAAVEKTIEAIGDLARAGADAMERGALTELGELMNVNHGLLSALSVSSAEIEVLVAAARRAGAVGAKLTGAGGGGCVIALAPGREEAVAAALSEKSKTVLIASLGAPESTTRNRGV